jgi:hypothetical protein
MIETFSILSFFVFRLDALGAYFFFFAVDFLGLDIDGKSSFGCDIRMASRISGSCSATAYAACSTHMVVIFDLLQILLYHTDYVLARESLRTTNQYEYDE